MPLLLLLAASFIVAMGSPDRFWLEGAMAALVSKVLLEVRSAVVSSALAVVFPPSSEIFDALFTETDGFAAVGGEVILWGGGCGGAPFVTGGGRAAREDEEVEGRGNEALASSFAEMEEVVVLCETLEGALVGKRREEEGYN